MVILRYLLPILPVLSDDGCGWPSVFSLSLQVGHQETRREFIRQGIVKDQPVCLQFHQKVGTYLCLDKTLVEEGA